MAHGPPIPFETKAGTPMIVSVKGSDGQQYELQLGVVVLDVREDVGQLNPEGFPAFQVRAAFAIGTRKKLA